MTANDSRCHSELTGKEFRQKMAKVREAEAKHNAKKRKEAKEYNSGYSNSN